MRVKLKIVVYRCYRKWEPEIFLPQFLVDKEQVDVFVKQLQDLIESNIIRTNVKLRE